MKKSTIFIALLATTFATTAMADNQRSNKRGFGESTLSYSADLKALARGCSWWYNWGNTPPASMASLIGADKTIEFVPMTWNASYDINALRTYYQSHPQDKYILGFNEPNFKAQSNMTPTQAAQAWPQLEALADELGLKLVAPALNYPDGAINDGVTYQPTEWMDAFIAKYKELYGKEPRMDYLALHCYMDAPTAMQGFVDNFAKRYGKQVWLTEFCAWESKDITAATQESSMIQKLMILEKDPNVFRYAWFKARNNNVWPYYSLIDRNGKAGTLSHLGFSYVNMSRMDSTYYYKVGERIPVNQFVDAVGLDSLSRGYDTQSDSVDITFLRGMTSTYQVDVPEDGDYILLVRAAVANGTRTATMPRFSVLDGEGNDLASRQTIKGTDNDSTYSATQIKLTLKAGKQKIKLSKENASKGFVSSLKLVKTVDENDADTKTVTIHRPTAEELNPSQPSGPADAQTEYGYWGSAALDETGKTTFDFDNSTDAVLIGTSTGVTNAFTGKTAANYNVDDSKNFMYIWGDTPTYNAESSEGNNSFGFGEDYSHYKVANAGWSGLGYASSKGNGKDLSMIDDDYIFHIGFRGTPDDEHASHEVFVGNAKFTLGISSIDNTPVLGDFKRDGSWTYFDIPVTVLKYIAGGDLFDNPENYEGNVVAIMSGGVQGTDLQFDNVFFYKNPKVKKGLPVGDNKTKIGKYAKKSVVDGSSTFNFDNVAKAVLIGTSTGVTNALTATTVANYNVDDQKNFFYIWNDNGGDYTAGSSEGDNSFGYPESSTALIVSGTGSWDGAGYSSSAGNGKDLSMIDDDWYLHFAMRGSDNITHPSQTVTIGNAQFVIGNATSGAQILGDYKRDGEWYSFDIPVSKLKQLAGKSLFDDDKNKATSYEGNVFAISTTHTKGAEVNFDNVFFYQKKDNSDAPVEPTYVTKSLDEEGKFTFDFDRATDAVLIAASSGVAEGFFGKTKADYRVDDTNNFLYIWENTMTPSTEQGVNSFGWNEGGNTVYTVGNAGWSGLGFASQNVGKDLSMLNDDYILHFAMKGTDNTVYLLTIGNAKIAIGSTGYKDGNNTIVPLCDFPRDGQWYNFDIPFSEFSSRTTNVFDVVSNYKGNVFAMLAGGTAGAKLQFDNVFFYKDIATGIKAIHNSESIIHNSKSGIYDLMGRRLEKITRPGIYIVNGRKIVKR